MISHLEILETNKMIREENLDIRTVTMGIDLLDTISDDMDRLCRVKLDMSVKKRVKTSSRALLHYTTGNLV